MTAIFLPSAIALIAPAMQSGKTTVARYLSTKYGYELVPFARPMKRMITTLLQSFGLGPREIEYLLTDGKEKPIHDIPGSPTARRLLQTLGTEWGRECVHQQLWVEAWGALAKQHPLVVTDDCRFPNEYARVKARPGAQVWRITRPDAVITAAHASEGQLDAVAVDGEIVNDGTLAELYAKVDALLEIAKVA